MFLQILSSIKSIFTSAVPRRSYQRCVRLQNFYSSLKRSPTYDVVFMPTAETAMSRSSTIAGWVDIPLTETGKIQARCAGQILCRAGHSFDVGFCSLMGRDMSTLCHLYQEMGSWIDVHQDLALNPQAMGAFTGQKMGARLIKKYGINKVDDALQKYTGLPPNMNHHHLYYENIRDDKRYEKLLPIDKIPLTESLPHVQVRVLPYWIDVIGKQIKLNKKPIVVADDSVLRVLIKHLDNLSDDDTMKLKFRQANPFVYTLDHNLRSIRGKRMQYLDNLVPIKLNTYVIVCPKGVECSR